MGTETNKTLYKILTALKKGYETGHFEDLFPYLAPDCVWESQWVLEPRNGYDNVVDYYTRKGIQLAQSDSKARGYIVELVDNLNPVRHSQVSLNGAPSQPMTVGLMYTPGKLCLLVRQKLNSEIIELMVDVKLNESGQVVRIDLCMPELFKFRLYIKETDETKQIVEKDSEGTTIHVCDYTAEQGERITMGTWKVYLQINGENETTYTTVDVEITPDQEIAIRQAIEEGIPLANLPFCEALLDKAAEDYSAELVDPDEAPEEPDPDDYEDEEEYEEAREEYEEELEEYQSTIDDYWETHSLEAADLYDPGDYTRFAEGFVGRQVSEEEVEAGEATRDYYFEEMDSCNVRYSVTIHYQDRVITGITGIDARGMEYESETSSGWSDCYPDFGFLEEELERTIRWVNTQKI